MGGVDRAGVARRGRAVSDLDALLAEIIARPGEDTLRLAYADCLEENGRGLHAQFIRDQIAGVVRTVPLSMLVPLEPLTGVASHQTTRHATAGGCVVTCDHMELVYRRGFADEVTCTAEDWLAHGKDARRLHPITRVNLTTWYAAFDLAYYPPERRQVVVPHGNAFSDGSVLDARQPGGTTYRERSCEALSAAFPGVGFTLPGPTRPVAAALEQITGRRA